MAEWDRADYLKETQKQLSEEKTYKQISVTGKGKFELAGKSSKLMGNPRKKIVISETENSCLKFNLKKKTNFAKLYFLAGLHICLFKIPGCLVIFSCGIPVKKLPDHQL